MLTATRALARSKQIGTPLPELPQLYDLHHGEFKFRPRGSQQTMIAGAPAGQKSGFAIWLAGQWARMGVTTLYVCADMDQHTASTRLVASVTGHSVDTVSDGLASGAEDYYAELLGSLPVRFSFAPNPTFRDIEDEIDAWVELWDEYPQCIFIDNLLDVVPDAGDSETAGYKTILLDVKKLARTTGAAVFILHHMSEAGTDPEWPAPRASVMGKVNQTPENVLSVALAEGGTKFRVIPVKHRNGPSDAKASHDRVVTFSCTPAKNQFDRWFDVAAPPVTTWAAPGED